MANRGAKPLEEAGRGMEGRFDESYMAWPAYTGDAPRGTAKVWDNDCEDIRQRLQLGDGGGHQDLL